VLGRVELTGGMSSTDRFQSWWNGLEGLVVEDLEGMSSTDRWQNGMFSLNTLLNVVFHPKNTSVDISIWKHRKGISIQEFGSKVLWPMLERNGKGGDAFHGSESRLGGSALTTSEPWGECLPRIGDRVECLV
jgi:hypothetical protein